MKLIRPLAVAVLVLAPSVARAQAPAYRRVPSDTVRYHEVSEGTAEVTTAGGPVTLRTRHDARVAVTFGAADTARAWFEALSIGMATPQGDRAPDTAPVLGKPYLLAFDARGAARTLSVPQFPESFEQVSDLTHEFADFFPRLPSAPLARGLTWTDTSQTQTTNAHNRTLTATRIGTFTVRGDSVVNGARVVVVDARSQNRLVNAGPAPQMGGLPMRSEMSGTEEGVYLFSPQTGRLVARRRTGRLAGTVTFGPDAAAASIQQTLTYQSRIDLVR